jgi:pyridoxal phosphate enzyme (YggS family)
LSSTSIAENIARIRERIAEAAQRAGRDPDEIELMAVTKTVPAARIREAYEAGIRLFGENRVQEFEAKHPELRGLNDARFHMIGHLQRNKAARAVTLFSSIESADSWRIAAALNEHAAERGKQLLVLLEINVGGEEQKSGLSPDSPELERILFGAHELPKFAIEGLMTVPPYAEDPEAARPYFRKLSELRDAIARRNLHRVRMDVLSMGMSHDFEVAIEEGATRVRIGSAIFGARQI